MHHQRISGPVFFFLTLKLDWIYDEFNNENIHGIT